MSDKNSVQLFRFHDNDFRIIVDPDGKEWFIANDICDALSIANPRSSIANIPERHKAVRQATTPGGKQKCLCVNEAGLYRLIMRSDKEKAIEFQDLVFEEILPQIRETGAYIPKHLTDDQIIRLRAKLSYKDMSNAAHDTHHEQKPRYSTLADTENKAVLGFIARKVQDSWNLTDEQAEHFRDFLSECALLALEAVELLSASRMRQSGKSTLHTKDQQAIIREVAEKLTPAFKAVADSMGIDFVTGKNILKGGR